MRLGAEDLGERVVEVEDSTEEDNAAGDSGEENDDERGDELEDAKNRDDRRQNNIGGSAHVVRLGASDQLAGFFAGSRYGIALTSDS